MNRKSNEESQLNQTDRVIHLLRIPALLVFLLSVLVVSGCADIPSKLYTTKDQATLSSEEPVPCDTFTYGEHPVVVVEGFEKVPEATLEVLTNGVVAYRQAVPLNSGHLVMDTKLDSTTTFPTVNTPYTEDRAYYAITYGKKIDLGPIFAGTYDLSLKTNNIVAATAHFTVNLPPELENERQEIESQRLQLQQATDQLKQLNAEIERDRATVDRSNPAMVTNFNARVVDYDQHVRQAGDNWKQFNIKVKEFNSRLETQSGMPNVIKIDIP